jgi:hypothetical protein
MSEQIVRYTFTVYCDTPVCFDEGETEGYPGMNRSDALAQMRALLGRHNDFSDTDFELLDTETLDC